MRHYDKRLCLNLGNKKLLHRMFGGGVWVGKLPTSRRYNQLPLLRSSPGGFARSWPYRTYPYVHYLSSAKVRKNYDVTNIKGDFLSSRGHKRTFWRENRPQATVFTHFFTKFATQRQQPFGLSPLP